MRGESSERVAWAALAIAIAASCALALALTRGTTFGADEYWFFVVNRGFDMRYLLSPHAGNLILVVRALYAAVFGLAGPAYVVLRIVEVVVVAAGAVLVAALARRRVGTLRAVLLAVPLLFLGAAGEVVLSPLGINIVLAVDLGLAALLALERRSSGTDGLACLLLTLAVATFSVGLAFTVAAAVTIALAPRRLPRAYVVVVPVLLYAAWRLFAPIDTGPGYLVAAPLRPGNVVHLPGFVLRSLAADAAALTGLYLPFGRPAIGLLGTLDHYAIGDVLVALGAAALVLRAVRGRVGRSIWPFVAFGVAFWGSIVVVRTPDRLPNSSRYLYAGSIVLVLVAAEALRGVRWRAAGTAALVALVAVAVACGVVELGDDAGVLHRTARFERAGEAALRVARGAVRENVLPLRLSGFAELVDTGGGVRAYLAAVRRWGDPGYTLAELRAQPEAVRELADGVLASIERVRLLPAVPPPGRCRAIPAAAGLAVRPPGVIVRAHAPGPVRIGRFARVPAVALGHVAAGGAYALRLLPDAASEPWRLAWPPGRLTACRL